MQGASNGWVLPVGRGVKVCMGREEFMLEARGRPESNLLSWSELLSSNPFMT